MESSPSSHLVVGVVLVSLAIAVRLVVDWKRKDAENRHAGLSPGAPHSTECALKRGKSEEAVEQRPTPPRPKMLPRQMSSTLGDLKVFSDAVGGHSSKQRGPAMLQGEGVIYKVFQDSKQHPGESPEKLAKKRKRGEMEAEFYARVHATNHPIQRHQPAYYGVQTLDDGNMYLILEDLTFGFSQPCVLDLKMGKRAYDEDASPDKIAKEKAKYPPQEVVGFRFSGMRVYQPATGDFIQSTRDWCFSLEPTSIPDALERFFFDGRSVRRSLIRSAVGQISEIAKCLEEFPTWRMYGASLLITYDGASAEDLVRVKLIDFAHCYEIKDQGGKDYGFLHGLYFLLSSLNEILDRGRRNLTRRGSLVDNATRLIVQSSERAMEDMSPSSAHLDAPSPVHVLREQSSSLSISGLDPLPAASTADALEILEHDPHLAPVVRKKRSTADAEDVRRLKSRRTRSMHDVLNQVAAGSGSDGSPVSTSSGHYRSPSSNAVIGASSANPFLPPILKNERSSSNGVSPASQTSGHGLMDYSPLKLVGRILDSSGGGEYPRTDSSQVDLGPSVGGPQRVQSQVGGAHGNIFMLEGTIEKEEIDKEHFETEVHFYQAIQNDALSKVMPALIRVDEHTEPRRLVLEDVTLLVAQPTPAALEMPENESVVMPTRRPSQDMVNVMDVKIGFRSFRADVSNEPKSSYFEKYMEVAKDMDAIALADVWTRVCGSSEGPTMLKHKVLGKRDYLLFRDSTTTSSQFGFRLTALKHFNFEVSQEDAKTRVTSYDDIVKVFERFLSSSGSDFDSELAANFIQELDTVLEAIRASAVFEESEFVGTSLLFVHQGGVPVIRWIDFANVSSPPSEDRNGIVYAIEKIRSILDLLIRRPYMVDI